MNDTSERESIGGQVPNPVAGAERYGAIEMANGDVVVYDQERPTAWLQSDVAVSPEA
jgi:hypothetical protein